MANSAIDAGWRHSRLTPSLAEVYRTVPVRPGAWWKKALAFAGPGYLVAVGSSVVLREVGDENTERLHYLAEQGLIPGVQLTVIDRQPFNGPTIVRLGDGTTRVVGQELALLLFCRPVDGE